MLSFSKSYHQIVQSGTSEQTLPNNVHETIYFFKVCKTFVYFTKLGHWKTKVFCYVQTDVVFYTDVLGRLYFLYFFYFCGGWGFNSHFAPVCKHFCHVYFRFFRFFNCFFSFFFCFFRSCCCFGSCCWLLIGFGRIRCFVIFRIFLLFVVLFLLSFFCFSFISFFFFLFNFGLFNFFGWLNYFSWNKST